ncbi:hypothetical protein PHYBLDRAFT_161331 [Phycomyces blakesleeanus NRRL 1555(-)]|uniref:AAA+ ATPase domain-containing protein n=1 Tax=Phycomyces blakesleeanus (strain ATCC 8743b / DSM 1359 / FGSC 10004 / NBRC 33097 / NRRL 1555) TaxID=763407 RepID=A0A163EPR0_PHYB8|nr:hypothetical protein PHYBLDRAFT_161331 [Phycomyces blakesleeanus NRRL 1555(-)]OAD80690.1 hypothetical protein PHYBLDRAFT_161331 [Phycomyces blakesleeanus NRRL 1555(-)]|eukprot:XP_018298730.1 hypothetical protein PHYBLDRAFT_161331 [Phycomyces blakesleeanus NRRL 1555(-)]
MDSELGTKVLISISSTDQFVPGTHGMPDFQEMCKRRLGSRSVTIGDCISWSIGGRPIKALIKDITGTQDGTIKIDRNETEIQVEIATHKPTDPIEKIDEEAEALIGIIRSSFENSDAYRILGIPVAKSILLHGVAGVGKTRLTRHASQVLQSSLFDISIHEVLALSEEFENKEFKLYNPIHLIIEQAKIRTPSIVIIRDLNALVNASEDSTKVLNIISQEIKGISSNEQVCVVGMARELRLLPEALQKTDIFQQHFTLSIPSMPQRKLIAENILQDFELDSQLSKVEAVNYYATQISMRTSGYVALDLKRLCKRALLKSLRRNRLESDDLAGELAQLSLVPESKKRPVEWSDFEYALSTYRPSQQIEVEASLPKRDWKEIGGCEKIKQKITQATLLPLLQPEIFTRLGVKPPSGLLLYGPSGCGKTAMVQALASESMMNVISIKGPEIFSKYLGETESKVRKLFATAKRIAPCIMFIDEMDAIGTRRGWDTSDSGGGVNERVLSTLLNEMDGVEGRQGVIVIGCTNRPDQIDDAILRPGRLDQLIYVGLPTMEERLDIVMILSKKMVVSPTVDLQSLAQQTEYCNGADLENMFRGAGILALRQDLNANAIEDKHLQQILETVCKRAKHQVLEQDSLAIYEKFRNDHSV